MVSTQVVLWFWGTPKPPVGLPGPLGSPKGLSQDKAGGCQIGQGRRWRRR